MRTVKPLKWTEKAGVAGMEAPLALFPRGACVLPAFPESSCQGSWSEEKDWVCYSWGWGIGWSGWGVQRTISEQTKQA